MQADCAAADATAASSWGLQLGIKAKPLLPHFA